MEMELSRLYDQREERNLDNVARTQSYLLLYQYTVENPPELPWLLMAHLVSRNAGYLMSDLARTQARLEQAPAEGLAPELLDESFLFLERANFLIFYDAWHHTLCYLLGRPPGSQTSRFMTQAWARYAAQPEERQLVLDLVHNEQHYIERRVVHNPRFAQALQMVAMVEAMGRERPIALPLTPVELRVGGFAQLDRRIETGRRIYDEVLADRGQRRAMYEWALAHPHTGDRAVAGGRATPLIREAWPLSRVRALEAQLHAPPEPDASYP